MLVGTGGRAQLEDGDLTRLGSLLADAIGDQLARPAQEHRGSLHQISALYELLNAAIASGSEIEVLRTFAEALSIWEEIEVLAYRADLDGRYTLTLALPGSDPAAVPRLLEHEPVIAAPSVRRLSPLERQNLGFSGDGETVLALLRSDGGQWAIALNAVRAAADGERSEMYIAALGHALNGCVAVATSRLTWAVMQRFVERDPPLDAARRALDELGRALGADGSFAVRAPAGLRVLMVGDLAAAGAGAVAPAGSGAVATAATLRSDVPAPTPFSAVLEMHARPGQSFTPRDAKLFDAAVAGFGAWLPAALRRIGVTERRGVARSFDQIVDRYAREAHETRDDASLILISAGDDDTPSLETTHAWIKRVRPQLRPTDLAGRLASGDLGILLLQTPHAGAEVVARRLTRVLAKASAGAEYAVRIGVASQGTEPVSAEALIAAARSQATRQPLSAS
jgi:hypothetical protein